MSDFVRESFTSLPTKQQKWPVLLAVWATFFLYGAIAAPVPGVNEPHYLCKSKHFWQPAWCERDFFLASPNAHTVFYATIGGLTRFASFEQSAWLGRAVSTLVLACGWIYGLSPLLFSRAGPLWTAWIFLGLASCGNFSGEWLVGGVEAKVPCYGFLLAGLGSVLRHRWLSAAAWGGLAVSFHPVIGLWGMLAFLFSQGVTRLLEFRRQKRQRLLAAGLNETQANPNVMALREQAANTPTNWWNLILPGILFGLLALPGLIPVIRLLTESASPETRYAATYLQVYFRLAHHLDPMIFPLRSYLGYALLLLIWGSSLRWGGRTLAKVRFDQIVLWGVVFALAGIVIGWGPRPPRLMPFFAQRMNLLKFYPFRLADLLLPIGVAISLIGVLERTALCTLPRKTWQSWCSHPASVLLLIFVASLFRIHATAETNRYSREDRIDWLDVCSWIQTHLPPDALVQSPTNGWAFKWFAQRAEFVSFKDCPQDAAGMVEWNRRLNFLQKWFESNYADQLYSAEELRGLRQQTGLTHLLTDRLGPLELEPIYRNQTFQVYDLQSLD